MSEYYPSRTGQIVCLDNTIIRIQMEMDSRKNEVKSDFKKQDIMIEVCIKTAVPFIE